MTPPDKHATALRIATGERFGWKRAPEYDCKIVNDGNWIMYQNGHMLIPFEKLPNYPGDLNAAHEMEEMMPEELQETYNDQLEKLVGYGVFDMVHATALQRCEAFVAACNLTQRVRDIEETL
jgi:hypothetical protein